MEFIGGKNKLTVLFFSQFEGLCLKDYSVGKMDRFGKFKTDWVSCFDKDTWKKLDVKSVKLTF